MFFYVDVALSALSFCFLFLPPIFPHSTLSFCLGLVVFCCCFCTLNVTILLCFVCFCCGFCIINVIILLCFVFAVDFALSTLSFWLVLHYQRYHFTLLCVFLLSILHYQRYLFAHFCLFVFLSVAGGDGSGQSRARAGGEIAVRERSRPSQERLGHKRKNIGRRPPGHRFGACVDRGESLGDGLDWLTHGYFDDG